MNLYQKRAIRSRSRCNSRFTYKNLGGGIAPNGAYIAGRKDLVELAAERLTVPGEGKELAQL